MMETITKKSTNNAVFFNLRVIMFRKILKLHEVTC